MPAHQPLIATSPVSPVAGYIGGKRNLASRLTAIVDRVPHSAYFEPFVGMGGIFLRRTRKPKSEAINDISGDVANLFRILQEHYPYLLDMLRFRVTSRAEFDRLRAMPPERLTDLQRAARFLYLQRLSFGGKVSGRTFGVAPRNPARFDITRLEPMLADVHDRLAGVVIEQLPYADFIRRYDHAGALFYLDPPYWDCERDYGGDVFGRADFASLAAQLGTLKGDFILSINDTPGVRETFAAFAQQPVAVRYSIAGKAAARAQPRGELIISNLPASLLAA